MHTLETISRLLSGFENEGVRYVHWKSNNNIHLALSGHDDLDILVHPEDAAATRSVLSELHFIQGKSDKDAWQPNMYHFFAQDAGSNQLVHLHLHYALTLGFDYHKNFTLPVLEWYLEDRRHNGVIFLPAPEREYIIMVIRTLIKNSRSAAIAEFPMRQIRNLIRKQPSGQTSASKELEWLHAQIDDASVKDALTSSGLSLEPTQFLKLAKIAASNDGTSLRMAAADLKKSLAATRQTSEAVSLWLSVKRINRIRLATLKTKIGGPAPHAKRPEFGGRIIAFIGGDGAGKSTNVSQTYKTLSRHLSVTQIHIGRPRRSASGLTMSIVAKILHALGQQDLAQNFKHLALAYNREKEFNRAQTARNAGSIVIMDRLPHNAITWMDAPRICTPQSRLEHKLATIERRIYNRIQGVDLIVVLKLDPQIACTRRPEDDRDTLLERSGEIWRQDWLAQHMMTVNTGDMSLKEVERAILDQVWHEISQPFLRLEILGTTGAGKSTLARGLAHEMSNARTSLPYHKYPCAMMVSAAQALLITGLPRTRFDIQVWKNLAQLLTFRRACRQGTIGPTQPASHIILDQGPLFQLVLAEKEGLLAFGSSLSEDIIKRFNNIGGIGLNLKLDRNTLRKRVIHRTNQPTRGAEMSDSAFESFAKDYDTRFQRLTGSLERTYDITSQPTPEQTMQSALAAITKIRKQL